MTEINVNANLGDMFGSIRGRGERPTCLSFVASDIHAALRPGWEPFSCEFLYYHAQKKANLSLRDPSDLTCTLEALKTIGQPFEEVWPCNLELPSGDQDFVPPCDIKKVYRRLGFEISGKIDDIIQLLNYGHPVMVMITVSDAFFEANDESNQVVREIDFWLNPFAERHAVIAIGHGQIGDERVILVRNSWGVAWGNQGTAWVSESYFIYHLEKLAILISRADKSENRAN